MASEGDDILGSDAIVSLTHRSGAGSAAGLTGKTGGLH